MTSAVNNEIKLILIGKNHFQYKPDLYSITYGLAPNFIAAARFQTLWVPFKTILCYAI